MTTTTKKTPAENMDAETPEVREGWHRHPNGGGWVEDTATVAPEAWVGPLGVACGNCWVGPKARIWGGVINGGEIRGGVIWGGEIWGGTIWGGVIRGGVISGGEIRGGVIWGGVIWGGVIMGGEIRGGVIWGGVISGGVIMGGVIMGGVIRGGKVKKSPLQIQGTRDFVTETPGGNIQIGCIELTLADWREKGAAIARTEGFTSAQVEEYRAYLDLFERLRPALSAPAEDAEVADVR